MHRYNPDPEEEWLAKHGYKEYPEDLPVPRRMTHGPHTPEGARRFLDADYPLPGTFPGPEGRAEGMPAWMEYLEKGVIYPGAKLTPEMALIRERREQRLADSDYADIGAARSLLEFDRLIGFNPLFAFQYAVLNFRKYSSVLIFEVNSIPHALHWNNIQGYAIDKKYISDDEDLASDNFYLFELVASSLGDENASYPVVNVLRHFASSPTRFWNNISPPLDQRDLDILGIHRY